MVTYALLVCMCGFNTAAIMLIVLSTHTCSQCLTVVESYKLTGRHTYFAMAITAVCLLMLLVSLAVFYRNLAPKAQNTVSAASELYKLEHNPSSRSYKSMNNAIYYSLLFLLWFVQAVEKLQK